MLTYNPLFTQDSTCILNVAAKDVGAYPYQFILNAKPPIPENFVEFQTFLGNVCNEKIIIHNHTAQTVSDFTVKVR